MDARCPEAPRSPGRVPVDNPPASKHEYHSLIDKVCGKSRLVRVPDAPSAPCSTPWSRAGCRGRGAITIVARSRGEKSAPRGRVDHTTVMSPSRGGKSRPPSRVRRSFIDGQESLPASWTGTWILLSLTQRRFSLRLQDTGASAPRAGMAPCHGEPTRGRPVAVTPHAEAMTGLWSVRQATKGGRRQTLRPTLCVLR
jgi:hypothetical protein